jgi:Rrf2 family protein
MWLSSTAKQAIHAILCIADCADAGPVRVDEIAAVIGCPRNYLSKTLYALTRAGILRSERGPRGGFRLALPPQRITLQRVIAPFERVTETRCLVGRPTCGDANPCPAHNRWKKVASGVEQFLGQTTIAELTQGNPRASAATRELMRTLRYSNPRTSHGSVA